MTRRGNLRVYLGAAPGVGKTYAMLDEGQRRAQRGTDVVVAYVETHGRPHTEEQLEGLEMVPRRFVSYRGGEFSELDVPGVLERAPQVALVDEMAHTNVPGSEREKRWQDIELLLEAGIDVISTVNVQHLESLNDVVEAITGVPQRETVPDSVVRAAEQVELVDMTPEALRRRMAHGNVYKPDKIDAALSNYFRPGNLTALRELALLWLADSVDEGLQRYRDQHGIGSTWETRERVVVALTGGPEGDTLIRRAARIAARATGGELLAVHVARSDGLAGSSIAELAQQRLLIESLGGSYHSVVGDDVPEAILDFARAKNATQIVIGASRRSPLLAHAHRSRHRHGHHPSLRNHRRTRRQPRLHRQGPGPATPDRRPHHRAQAARRGHGWGPARQPRARSARVARGTLSLASDMLLFLLAVVVVSLIGGFYPGFATAVRQPAAQLLLRPTDPHLHDRPARERPGSGRVRHHRVTRLPRGGLRCTPQFRSRAIQRGGGDAVDARRQPAARRAGATRPARAGAGDLCVTSVTLLRRDTAAPASVGASTSRKSSGGLRGTWSCVASIGDDPCLRPEDGDAEVPVGEELNLVLRGRTLAAEDQRVLTAFAAQVAVAYQQRRLAEAAQAAAPLAEVDRMRTALLNAVSHDLRTPIASAKAAVSSLLSDDVTWTAGDQRELLVNADGALDRLTSLVTNLLDLSRLQAGVLSLAPRAVGVDEIVSLALDHAAGDQNIEVDVPDTLPAVLADPGLLERVVANLVENALRYSPPGQGVRVAASTHGDDGRTEGDRYGAGHTPRRSRERFRTLPAAGRPQHQQRGSRTRARHRSRIRGGDARHDHPGGHPGRRTHGGRHAAGRARRGDRRQVASAGRRYSAMIGRSSSGVLPCMITPSPPRES